MEITAHPSPAPGSVDVVIPVYNCERFIRQALESVQNQDYPPASIIVVDDGSTDGTAEVVRAVSGPVPVIYHYQQNRGLSAARNAGVRLCTGEYVAFLDADDEWYPQKLSSQMRLFGTGEFDNLGAVYCRYEIIDEEGRVNGKHHVVEPDPRNRGYIFERLLEGNMITGSGSGIVVKRSCFDEVALFDENLKACEDWDMWLRLAQSYQFDYVDQRLVGIRRHGSNMQKDSRLMYRNLFMLYDKWAASAHRFGWHTAWSNLILWKIVRDLPDLESYRMARDLISAEAKGHLFHGARGSLAASLLLKGPSIFIVAVKRILRWQDRV